MDVGFSQQYAYFLSEGRDKLLPSKLVSALAVIAKFDAWRLISVDAEQKATVIDFRNTLATDQDGRGRDIDSDPIVRIVEKDVGEGYYSSQEIAPHGLIKTHFYEQALQLGLVLNDHVGFVGKVGKDHSVCLSLTRSDLFPMFSKTENDRFRAAAPLVIHALEKIGAKTDLVTEKTEQGDDGDTKDLLDLVVESPSFTTLSTREREVAKLLFEGQSAKEIARALEISPGTVRNHIKHIYLKLRLNSRGEFHNRCLGELMRSHAA